MSFSAFIFDLDGTLLDSNPLHVRAWCAAFELFDIDLPEARIFAEIGKGSDQLIPALIGPENARKYGKWLSKAHGKEFERLARKTGLRFFPHWNRLLDACRAADTKLALATSGDQKQLNFVRDMTEVDLSDHFDVIVTAADVDQTKPEPDLFSVALQKLRQPKRESVVVGDTPYDCQGALRARLSAIGLRSGGHTAKGLQSAGAFVVYDDCADMLRNMKTLMES